MKNIVKLNESQLREIVEESVKMVLREYRERKSYQKDSDQPFINRMNQFADKYGYDRFRYGRQQGNPEDYAKNMIQRHNTFLRGVDTNMASDEALAYAKEELKKQGNSNPTMQQIAQFAATNPMKGNKGYYASNVGNADIYGNGGTKQKNGHFAGTAKIIRPYQLGNDRMKWFDEGDFQVKNADDYNVDGYENNQQAVSAQIGNGEVVDTWNTGNEGNSEVQIGGQTNFGGWLTDKERQHGQNTKANNRWNQMLQRIGNKHRNGQKLSQKEQDIERYPMKYTPEMPAEYNTWLTSRNNYKPRS
jgi:hypothetical protein